MSQVHSPFKFLDSYEQSDADVFFGREKETQDLYNALSGVKHLMVYGPSGAGKTSLIECGLRNQFSDADWFAITIRRGGNINASVFESINKALSEKIETDPVTKMPVDPQIEFGHAIEELFAERYQPVYLLFDQFEELLISGEEDEKKKFFTLLNKLIRNKVPCRILLIMREEFIGHLSEFEPLCPSIFQYRFRVEKMGRKNVEEVITNILEAPRYRAIFDVDDTRRLSESVLSKLPDRKKEIELAHVQVFLGELWDRALSAKKNNKLPLLSSDLIQYSDNLEGILESFLKKQISELEVNYGKRIPLELLAAMISERFTKLQLSEAGIKADLDRKKVVSEKPVANLLKEFEQRRIIRTIKIGDETQYEISHDVLALVVGQNLTEEMKMREKAEDIYKVYCERQGLFTQDDIDYLRPFQQSLSYPPELESRIEESIAIIKRNRDEELAKTRKRLRIVRSILGVALFALMLAGYLGYKANVAKKEAERQSALATERTKEALIQKGIAENQKEIADVALTEQKRLQEETNLALLETKKQKEIADKKTKEAIENMKVAVAARIVADTATTQAIKAKIEADTARARAERARSLTAVAERNSSRLRLLAIARNMAIQSLNNLKEDSVLAILLAGQAYKFNMENGGNTRDPDLFKSLSNAIDDKPPFLGHSDIVRCVFLSDDGNRIFSGSDDGKLYVWDANNIKSSPFALNTKNTNGKGIRSIDVYHGKVLSGTENGMVLLWENADKETIPTTFLSHSGLITGVRFISDNLFVSAGSDGFICVWDLQNDVQPVFKKQMNSSLTGVSVSGDKSTFACAGESGKIWIFSSSSLNDSPVEMNPGGFATAVALNYSGKRIATGDKDGKIVLYDITDKSGNRVSYTEHKSRITALEFSNDSRSLASSSYDNTIRIWNLADPKQAPMVISDHTSWVMDISYNQKGDILVSCSNDKSVRLTQVDSEILASKVCAKVSRNLTISEWEYFVGIDIEYQKTCPEISK